MSSYDFWQMIARTPWWVALLFAYLTYGSYLATKPKTIPLRSFYILLAVVIGTSILGMAVLITVNKHNVMYYAGLLPVGLSLGWLQCARMNIKAIEGKKVFYVQGTWTLSIIVLSFFYIRYYYLHSLYFDPAILKTPFYSLLLMSFYGLFTGLIAGRLLYMHRILRVGPFVPAPSVELGMGNETNPASLSLS